MKFSPNFFNWCIRAVVAGVITGVCIGFAGMNAHAALGDTAIWGVWTSTESYVVQCPDLSQGIDPMGQFVVVTKTVRTKNGSVSVATPTVIYPDSKECESVAHIEHKQMFEDAAAAEAFNSSCGDRCIDWRTIATTDEDIVKATLEERGWKIHRVPGGDRYRFPDGVFQVWSKTETEYKTPIERGNSRFDAIERAVKATGPR